MMIRALVNVVAWFVRRTWLVLLIAGLVCTRFAAHAIAALSADEPVLLAPGMPVTRGAPRPPPPPPRRTAPSGDVLVERNIFCSICTPLADPGAPSVFRGKPATLIATALGAEPRATVRVIPTDVQGSWGLGATIPGVGRIDRIGPTSIDVIDDLGAHTRLSLLESPAAGGRDDPARPSPAPAHPLADRVRKVAEGTFEAERSLVRELVTTGGNGIGASPVLDGTDIKGIRLTRVRADSAAAALELRPGDILSAIDGEPIRSAQQLLDLYAKLDQVSSVEIAGTRRGKPLALTIRLR